MAQEDIRDRIEALKYEGADMRQAAFEVLVKIGGPAVPALIEALKDEDIDIRQVAAWALVRIGEPAVPALIKMLKDRNERSDIRQVVTWVLTRIGGAAVPALVEALKGQDEDDEDVPQAMADTAASAQPKEMAVEQEIEETVLPKPKLRVEDLFQRAQSRGRLSRPHRTAIAPFSITEVKVIPAQAHQGETITISFKVANNSDVDSYYPITLRINGEVMDAEVVSLPRRTTIPLSFTAVGALPGVYKVEVNDCAGKFTVAGKELRGKKEPGVFRPAIRSSESEVKTGLKRAAIEASSGQRQVPKQQDIAPTSKGKQSAIDKVADYIEFGLDKMGDGIAFPLKKMVDVSASMFKTEDKKAKKRHN